MILKHLFNIVKPKVAFFMCCFMKELLRSVKQQVWR